MAFRTNKVPAIEERTVSGSSVSFHSNFALPLKACKVSFEATQSGTGDPSPTNVRPISGVSSITLGANSSATVIDLDGTRYGGYVDVVNKKLTITYVKYIFDGSVEPDSYNYRPQANSIGCYWNNLFTFNPPSNINTPANVICDKLATVSYGEWYSNDIDSISFQKQGEIYRVLIRIKDITLTTKEAVVNYLTNNPITIVYELEEPIDISLSDIPTLSTIIGNNTFFTDTGTLEITFADLQEKTASGSVASFNTILQKPLVNGEFTIEAYQEGTGDPAPDNVRDIVGFNALNITKAGKNLFNGTFGGYQPLSLKSGNKLILQGDMSNDVYLVLRTYDADKNFLQSTTTSSGTGTRYGVLTLNKDISFYRIERSSTSGTYNDIMISFGNTVKTYEPYVTPEVKTKQLGETVYGGSYNSVSGVKSKTLLGKIYNGSEDWQSNYSNGVFLQLTDEEKLLYNRVVMCNEYKPLQTFATIDNLSVKINSGKTNLLVKDENRLSVDSFKSFLINNPMLVIYEITEPIESNIGATPIETYDGSNNIFCDTGDTSVVYNDLDLAKRGSFREVFKLP